MGELANNSAVESDRLLDHQPGSGMGLSPLGLAHHELSHGSTGSETADSHGQGSHGEPFVRGLKIRDDAGIDAAEFPPPLGPDRDSGKSLPQSPP